MVITMLTIELSEVEEGSHAGRIKIGLTPVYRNRLKALPGTLYSKKEEAWTISRTYPSALALGGLAREIRAKVQPSEELALWIKKEKTDWANLADRANRVLPAQETENPAAEGLFPHQVQDINWLTFGDGPSSRILLNEPGLGKTRSVIKAMQWKALFPALVMCPRGVAVTGWQAELKRAAPELRVGMATGTPVKRRQVLAMAALGDLDVVVMGYEAMRTHTRFRGFPGVALKRCEKCGGAKTSEEGAVTPAACQAHPKEINGVPWRLVVADEGHRGLNPRSATRMAMGGVVHAAGAGCSRWLVTATPVSKRHKADRVWSLLNWIDDEAWPAKGDWVDRYCLQGFNNGGFIEVKGFNPERLAEMRASVDAVTRRVLVDQALSLPPTLRGGSLVKMLAMGTEQKRVYAEMRDKMIARVDEGLVTAKNVASLTGRLTMLASAVGLPGEEKGEMFVRLPSCKYDELVSMIENEELPDQWVMAFNSRRVLRLFCQELAKKFEGAVDIGIIDGLTKQAERDQTIDRFQAGHLPVVAFTHAAGGVGITLTAAEMMVMVERPWSGWQEQQSLGRVRRLGMKPRSVQVVDLITEHTVEAAQQERIGDDALVLEDLVQDTARLKAFLAGSAVLS